MSRSFRSIPRQESYFRTREDPIFSGLLTDGDDNPSSRDHEGTNPISSSISDTGTGTKTKHLVPDIFDNSIDIPLGPSSFPDTQSLSKLSKPTSFDFPSFHLKFDDLDIDGGGSRSDSSPPDDDTLGTSEKTPEQECCQIVLFEKSRPFIEKSYEVQRRMKSQLSKIPPLPQSAASFYNGFLPLLEIVESCESIWRLNGYLKSKREDVNAGVPGKFLHAVMGQDVSDVGTIAATIMYAFYLNETLGNDQLCTVPVINMKRADLRSHAELKWLLDMCRIEESSLIFVEEIDLSYYDLFGSLKIVLVNGHKLPTKAEALKEAVVEIFNCRKGESTYPWVETVTVREDASSCTAIAEKFLLTSPEILAAQGFSRLLLAGILLDTANLSSTNCTDRDKYIATLLINGAGRFGCNGLYQILRHKMYDVSDLKVIDILRKDFKKWTRVGKPDIVGLRSMVSNIGMSSIGISVEQLLSHGDTAAGEIKHFQYVEKVRLLMIVSGYYDSQKNFKREILVAAESVELMKNLLIFLNSNASQLPLKVLPQPGLRDEMRAFEIDRVTSRKTIERLLEEFGGSSSKP